MKHDNSGNKLPPNFPNLWVKEKDWFNYNLIQVFWVKIKNHWSHHFIDICPRTFDKVVFLPYGSLWTITMSRRVSCYLRISIAVMSDCQSASSPLLLGHFRSSFKETTKVYHTYIKGHLCKRLRRNQSNSTGMLNSSRKLAVWTVCI